jgi:hypothetical protein
MQVLIHPLPLPRDERRKHRARFSNLLPGPFLCRGFRRRNRSMWLNALKNSHAGDKKPLSSISRPMTAWSGRIAFAGPVVLSWAAVDGRGPQVPRRPG